MRHRVDGTAELLEQLKSQKPADIGQTLIHGDCTIDNVLLQGGTVSGFIDWSGGAHGDPRYDVALAIRPQDGLFETEEDFAAFFGGYGDRIITDEEYDYFNGLYEFF